MVEFPLIYKLLDRGGNYKCITIWKNFLWFTYWHKPLLNCSFAVKNFKIKHKIRLFCSNFFTKVTDYNRETERLPAKWCFSLLIFYVDFVGGKLQITSNSTRNWSIQTSSTWLLQWVWSAGKYVHPRSVRSKISSRGWCLGPDSVIQASSVVLSCPVTEVAVLAPTLCSGLQWEENTAAGRSLGSYNRKLDNSHSHCRTLFNCQQVQCSDINISSILVVV